jgi:hypothetical protein
MEVAISFWHGREFRGFSLLCKNEIATYHPCMEMTLDCYNSVAVGYYVPWLSFSRMERVRDSARFKYKLMGFMV